MAGAALAWLGRHGSTVIALRVFVGLLLPPLAALQRPLLIPAIIGPGLIAPLLLDWRQLGGELRNRAISTSSRCRPTASTW